MRKGISVGGMKHGEIYAENTGGNEDQREGKERIGNKKRREV
jgi:hypothetical protein